MRKLYLTMMCLPLLCGAMDAQTISLDGEWQLTYWKQPAEGAITSPEGMAAVECHTIPATVPGNVEIDLQAAGLIADPMVGKNIYALRQWEDVQYCYTRSFEAPELRAGDRYQLWFGGIDCLADIWVNGIHVGSAEDMLIEQSFDVTDHVRPGANTVQVILRSTVLEGQKYLLGQLSIRLTPAAEAINIRKAPHMFGWDIMPRLVSAGLWRSVELRTVRPTRIRDISYIVHGLDVEAGKASLYADLQVAMPFARFDKTRAVYTLSLDGKVVKTESEAIKEPAMRHDIKVENARFWWPRGYGEPVLYDLRVDIVAEDGEVLDSRSTKVGLRTVRLDMNDINLPDSPGRFQFIVNGVPVFVHGTNWVPMDALHSRDPQFYDESIAMAVDLNCNMIRCWGGNVYEDHHFYDLCDEAGIMIWQDFTMGCTMYPNDDAFASAIYEEVKSVVVKLRNHPCIATWAGNNEDDQSVTWGLNEFKLNPNRDRISRRVIPDVLFMYDPTRPYIPSSPYYSEEVWKHGNEMQTLPENHLWGPRGYYKDPFYIDAQCKFVSEIGYHGCPNRESLEKMMTPECVYPWTDFKSLKWNEEWLTKAVREFEAIGDHPRDNLMTNQVRLVFGEVPENLDDFIFASQSVQAEAMKYFVEMWRGHKFADKTGILWWNLRDGWPILSDAITDYYGGKKIAYSFLRNVQKDVCVMINDPVDGKYQLVAVNDTRAEHSGSIKVTDVASGKAVYKGSFTVPVNGRNVVAGIPEKEGQGLLKIEYTVDGASYTNHYLYGKAPFSLSDYRSWISKLEY